MRGLEPRAIAAVWLVSLAVHLAFAQELFTVPQRCLAAVTLSIATRVVIDYVRAVQVGVLIGPTAMLVVLQLWVMFGAAQFFQSGLRIVGGFYVPSSGSVTEAAIAVAFGAVAFVKGAQFGGRRLSRYGRRFLAVFPVPSHGWLGPVLVYVVVALPIHWAATVRPDLLPIAGRNFLHRLSNPYLALILLLWVSPTTVRWRVVKGVVTFLYMAVGVWSGMLEAIVVPVFVVLVVGWMRQRRINWPLVLVAVVLVLLANPAKHYYRAMIGYEKGIVRTDLQTSARVAADAVRSAWSAPGGREQSLDSVTSRTSYLLQMAQVVEWVPTRGPFRYGSGILQSLSYSVIPRFAWPEKPPISALANDEYAVAFLQTTFRGLERVTIGMPLLLGAYWDFGLLGVAAYLGIFGLLVGMLFGPSNGVRGFLGSLLFSAVFFQTLLAAENLIASVPALVGGTWLMLNLLAAAAKIVGIHEPAGGMTASIEWHAGKRQARPLIYRRGAEGLDGNVPVVRGRGETQTTGRNR